MKHGSQSPPSALHPLPNQPKTVLASRARVLIIQLKSVLCPANPSEIEQKFTFHMVSHLQRPKVKSTLLSIYDLLSALYNV